MSKNGPVQLREKLIFLTHSRRVMRIQETLSFFQAGAGRFLTQIMRRSPGRVLRDLGCPDRSADLQEQTVRLAERLPFTQCSFESRFTQGGKMAL
jgi:hypothetical protein